MTTIHLTKLFNQQKARNYYYRKMAERGKIVKPYFAHLLIRPATAKERCKADEDRIDMILLQPTTPLAGRFLTEFSSSYWKSLDGSARQIAFMETSHLFNCFRMLYDSAADEFGWPKMRASGLKARFHSETVAHMANFANEIIARGDLPFSYVGTMNTMLEFCLGGRLKIEHKKSGA